MKKNNNKYALIGFYVLFCFILLSNSIWGLFQLNPLEIGPFNFHYLDFIFLMLIVIGGLQKNKLKLSGIYIKLAGEKWLKYFLMYTLFLAVYSIYEGASINNTLRFTVRIYYMSVYFFIPYFFIKSGDFVKFYRLILSFVVVGILVIFYQNITGWQPSFVTGYTSMSNTQMYGNNLYRTYSPNYQWVFVFTIISLCVLYIKKSFFNVLNLLLGVVVIFLSFSRNLYIAFICIVLFFVLFNVFRNKGIKSKVIVAAMTIILLITVALLFDYFPDVSKRFADTQYDINSESGTFNHRIRMLDLAINMSPNIYLGAGFGSLEFGDIKVNREQFIIASLNSGSDSGLVNLYFRFGMIGVGLFIILLFSFFAKNFERLKKMDFGFEFTIILSACLYIIGVLIQSFISDVFTSASSSSVLFTLMAFADIVWYVYNNKILINQSA